MVTWQLKLIFERPLTLLTGSSSSQSCSDGYKARVHTDGGTDCRRRQERWRRGTDMDVPVAPVVLGLGEDDDGVQVDQARTVARQCA